jgi:hypothetical protein
MAILCPMCIAGIDEVIAEGCDPRLDEDDDFPPRANGRANLVDPVCRLD